MRNPAVCRSIFDSPATELRRCPHILDKSPKISCLKNIRTPKLKKRECIAKIELRYTPSVLTLGKLAQPFNKLNRQSETLILFGKCYIHIVIFYAAKLMYLYYNNKHSRKIVEGQWLIWALHISEQRKKRITPAIVPLLSAEIS